MTSINTDPATPYVPSVNGYAIIPVASKWGTLFEVIEDGTAFESVTLAVEYAAGLPAH